MLNNEKKGHGVFDVRHLYLAPLNKGANRALSRLSTGQ